MDYVESPEKDQFPGLYAEASAVKIDESDFSEGDYEKVSKKDLLIGRRKDKKDLKYATLDGESSPEEELETKSPSKSKKSKTFKFTSSKSKDKHREKSRDKDKIEKDDKNNKDQHLDGKDKDSNKKKDKDKKEEEKLKKKKEREEKKKDKKLKQTSVSEEILDLGDLQPVFGCSISLATQRSRSHDGIDVPLIIRDCIDFLQEYGLQNDQIYKIEPLKSKLQHFKRLYNNRESNGIGDLDASTACGLLKMFLQELPEPILTTDLITRFEEAASYSDIQNTETELKNLLELLPSCNRMLLSWILLHFDAVIENEKYNKINSSSLAMLLSPSLQMSHRLLVTLLCHSSNLFPDVKLIKYAPPITASSPKLPETPNEIQIELSKQESLLAQIHIEMNAGFVSKKREEQLWEVSRIITQLKRKLRSFEKKQDFVDGRDNPSTISSNSSTKSSTNANNKLNEEDVAKNSTQISELKKSPIRETLTGESNIELSPDDNPDNLYIDPKTQLLMVPESHAQYLALIRLQLENNELQQWKSTLQTRINAERSEILKLKKLLTLQEHQKQQQDLDNNCISDEIEDYDKIINNYIKENNLLDHKKCMLAQELFEEKRELIQLQVELALQKFTIKIDEKI